MQRWLDVECALAAAQGELGIIPAQAAADIVAGARMERLDIGAIQRGLQETGHSLIPLLQAWQKVVPPKSGQYIHFGATTQDIQDSAQNLELRDIIAIIEGGCHKIMHHLIALIRQYRDLVTIGRTHGQPALPTTLGLKMSGWLDETCRNYQRLTCCRDELLVAQLYGGVGTMAALSDKAFELLKLFSKRLGLKRPAMAWHNCRDRYADYLNVLGLLSGGLARAANEICQLAKYEINEVNEPFHKGQIGSSTMPHKVNPERCEQVVVLAKLVKANSAMGLDCLINEHERDYRAVRLEWVSLTEASLYTCNILRFMEEILGGLRVNRQAVEHNVKRASELINSEALMFALGEKIGKQSAHALLYQAAIEAHTRQIPLVQILLEDRGLQKHFPESEIKALFAAPPRTGMARDMCEQVCRKAKEILAVNTPPPLTPCPLEGYCHG